MTIEQIARICHETNRHYCFALGDYSQVTWAEAPAWQHESAMHGVGAILNGVTLTPEEQHESWCAEKRSTGWKYGPTKDTELRTHPCLLPYHELPVEQQRKDRLFRAIVQALRD